MDKEVFVGFNANENEGEDVDKVGTVSEECDIRGFEG